VEFVRRFLLHVLPSNFVKIRYYGFMANRCRKKNIAHCRRLLGQPQASRPEQAEEQPASDNEPGGDTPSGDDTSAMRCPVCQKGRMCIIARMTRQRQQQQRQRRKRSRDPTHAAMDCRDSS